MTEQRVMSNGQREQLRSPLKDENDDEDCLPDGNSSPKLGAGVRRTEGSV